MSNITEGSGQQVKAGSVPVPKMKKGVGTFMREAMAEMKKVNWPTKKETTRLTGVVFAVCFSIIIFLFVLSVVFEQVFKIITGSR
ncbi:MAG: preprotein translocase subunit SecE [Chthonomonas sp.]|nr:preprotein translocase subunit SecE [Chthonomonas sp.]